MLVRCNALYLVIVIPALPCNPEQGNIYPLQPTHMAFNPSHDDNLGRDHFGARYGDILPYFLPNII